LVERSSGEALRLTAEAKAFIEEFDDLSAASILTSGRQATD